MQHGADEIREAAERDAADEDRFHGRDGREGGVASAQVRAVARVGRAERKKREREENENHVCHGTDDTRPRRVPLVKTGPQCVKKTSRLGGRGARGTGARPGVGWKTAAPRGIAGVSAPAGRGKKRRRARRAHAFERATSDAAAARG